MSQQNFLVNIDWLSEKFGSNFSWPRFLADIITAGYWLSCYFFRTKFMELCICVYFPVPTAALLSCSEQYTVSVIEFEHVHVQKLSGWLATFAQKMQWCDACLQKLVWQQHWGLWKQWWVWFEIKRFEFNFLNYDFDFKSFSNKWFWFEISWKKLMILVLNHIWEDNFDLNRFRNDYTQHWS